MVGNYEELEKLILSTAAEARHGLLNHRFEHGWTPLMFAAGNRHHKIVQLLLRFGAEKEDFDSEGRSALIHAARSGCANSVRVLHSFGAHVDAADKTHSTALIHAALKGHRQVVFELLNAGARVDLITDRGWTALMCAAGIGHLEIVKVLLASGANPHTKSHNDETALSIAKQHQHAQIVKVLVALTAAPQPVQSSPVATARVKGPFDATVTEKPIIADDAAATEKPINLATDANPATLDGSASLSQPRLQGQSEVMIHRPDLTSHAGGTPLIINSPAAPSTLARTPSSWPAPVSTPVSTFVSTPIPVPTPTPSSWPAPLSTSVSTPIPTPSSLPALVPVPTPALAPTLSSILLATPTPTSPSPGTRDPQLVQLLDEIGVPIELQDNMFRKFLSGKTLKSFTIERLRNCQLDEDQATVVFEAFQDFLTTRAPASSVPAVSPSTASAAPLTASRATTPASAVVKQLDPNDITKGELLGRGATCNVYAGTFHGGPVAIKCFKEAQVRDRRHWLEREAQVWATLQVHPNIATMTGVVQFPDSPLDFWIVMEECQTTLRQHLQRPDIVVTSALKWRWAQQITAALGFLHQHDYLHRDLKAENVLLTNNYRDIRLTDFGLSSAVRGDDNRTIVQQTILGSDGHMAPELFKAGGYRLDTKIDIYALGITFFEMICPTFELRPPPDMSTMEDQIQYWQEKATEKWRPVLPRHFSDAFEAGLAKLITKCWNENPALRPNTAQILSKLERLQARLPAANSNA